MRQVRRYTITVDERHDAAMVAWFEAQSNRAASLRRLVSDYVAQYGLTDVADAVVAKRVALGRVMLDCDWDGPRSTRRFSVSLDLRRDVLTARWFDAQSNCAASLRVLVKDWVAQFGVCDVWKMDRRVRPGEGVRGE